MSVRISLRNARSQEQDINLEKLPDTLFSESPGDEALQNLGRLLVLENAVYVMQRHCSLFDLVSKVARPVPQHPRRRLVCRGSTFGPTIVVSNNQRGDKRSYSPSTNHHRW